MVGMGAMMGRARKSAPTDVLSMWLLTEQSRHVFSADHIDFILQNGAQPSPMRLLHQFFVTCIASRPDPRTRLGDRQAIAGQQLDPSYQIKIGSIVLSRPSHTAGHVGPRSRF